MGLVGVGEIRTPCTHVGSAPQYKTGVDHLSDCYYINSINADDVCPLDSVLATLVSEKKVEFSIYFFSVVD